MTKKGVEYPPVRRLARSKFKRFAGYENAMWEKRKTVWRRWALYASLLAPAHLVMFYLLFGWGAQPHERIDQSPSELHPRYLRTPMDKPSASINEFAC